MSVWVKDSSVKLDARHHQTPFAVHGDECRIDDGRACTCSEPFPFRPEQALAVMEPLQQFYNAVTVLQAALTFTHETADLLRPELNDACVAVITARSRLRRLGIVEDKPAALIDLRGDHP